MSIACFLCVLVVFVGLGLNCVYYESLYTLFLLVFAIFNVYVLNTTSMDALGRWAIIRCCYQLSGDR